MKTVWNKRRNGEVDNNIINDYLSGLSSRDVAKKNGFKTCKTVLDILKEYNIPRRPNVKKTYYDQTFFRRIHRESESYALGLFFADGYVLSNYKGIGIQLQARDRSILEDLSLEIGPSCSFLDIPRRRPHQQDMIRMTLHSTQIATQAMVYGLTRQKTFTLNMEKKIPKKMLNHFCRGFFDGDGTIGMAKTGNIWCQFVTCSICFANQFCELSLPSKCKVYSPSKGRKTYTVRVIGGNSETIKFMKWMYKDSNFYIRRKYEKMQSIIR